MDRKLITDTLKELLHDLCDGCGGCKDKCTDYEVLEFLISEYDSPINSNFVSEQLNDTNSGNPDL